MKITNYRPTGVNPYQREMQKNEQVQTKQGKILDQLEISNEALKLQKQQSDPARQEKINELKNQIQTGTYKINHEELAKNIYNYYGTRGR